MSLYVFLFGPRPERQQYRVRAVRLTERQAGNITIHNAHGIVEIGLVVILCNGYVQRPTSAVHVVHACMQGPFSSHGSFVIVSRWFLFLSGPGLQLKTPCMHDSMRAVVDM